MPLNRNPSKHHPEKVVTSITSIHKLIPELSNSVLQLIQSCSLFPATKLSIHLPVRCSFKLSQIPQPQLAPAKSLPICSLQSITSKASDSFGSAWPFPTGSPLPRAGCLTGRTSYNVPLWPEEQIKQWALLSRYITEISLFLSFFCENASHSI